MTGQRAVLAEFVGTLALLAIVVGSGVMGERLAAGNDAIALLANATATAAGLYVLIAALGPISGAHFNPAVTLAMRLRGERPPLAAYLAAQILGAAAGVLLAHAMFDLALVQPGLKVRSGAGQWLAEGIATGGLLLTILLGQRHRPSAIPALVAAYIFAAYWFTASTSFANPAVTMARALTQTFAGIRPADVPGFVAAQLTGMLVALWLARALLGSPAHAAATAAQSESR